MVQLDQLDSRSLAFEFVGLTECSGGITSSRFIRLSCSTAKLARKMCVDKLTQALFPHVAGEGIVACNMHLWKSV